MQATCSATSPTANCFPNSPPAVSSGHTSATIPVNPIEQADEHTAGETLAARRDRLDGGHPEWTRGDHDRRDAARHPLLRPDDAAIAEANHQEPEQRQAAPVRTCRQPLTAHAKDRGEHRAGDDVADAADEAGRNRLERDADPEIGGAPDEAHREPRQVGGTLRGIG